ncbi:unnamed protein product [Brassica rapa subsp. trilocularis]
MGNLHGLRRSHHAGETPKATYPPSSSAPSGPQMTLDPYCHVDCSLRSLAGKAEGFGLAAVGGLNGPKNKSSNIWIDRCSFKNYYDGLIDITRESTDITVSRCHFMNHNKTMLTGADPSHA